MILINPVLFYILLTLGLVVILYSLILVYKHEEKHSYKFLWTLFVLFIPIIGSTIYTIKYFVETNKNNK